MSSAIDWKSTVQNSAMREYSQGDCNILAALSNNSLPQAKTSIQGLPLSEQETPTKSTSGEHFVPPASPPWINSTHQCHQSRAGHQEDKDITWSSGSSHRGLDLADVETEKSPKQCASCEIRPSDLTSFSPQDRMVDETDGFVVQTEDVGLRSILKKQMMTPRAMTLDLEQVPSDTPNRQMTFNDIEHASDSKMAEPETDSRRGLIVVLPTSKYRRMSSKHVFQLAAMSLCGFILVAFIVAWVFSPIFL